MELPYLPLSHWSHLDAPPVVVVPIAQREQSVRLSTPRFHPDGQSTHIVALDTLVKVPGGHGRQDAWPPSG
jgi:hypothetical protein